ncbi:hypothetical protein PV327_006180 [Microctonus hyperodae]|uniref:EB domain-containing protein n=1 Tax=Microctonus hyperodae TaxID=165561 RepID=A0AA39KHT9_MICHY|nr:hypothetical protein PV327_006180 [Microctonus hyperodae]
MRNFSVLIFFILCLITASCSSISIAFKYGYPCIDNNKHRQKTLMNCSYDRDCPDNAYCRNHECSCKAGFLLSSNKIELQCLRSIGQMCKTQYNCHVEGSSSFCVDGFCSCPLDHHASTDGKSCLKSLYLGDNCMNDNECITEYSNCYGICGCQDGYISSDDKKHCLKAANSIGDPCEEDLQCKALNAKCGEEKKCTCIMDFKRLGPVCLRKINPDMLGKSCSSRSQCVKPMPETDLNKEEVVNIDCLNGKCSCAQDYILTEDNTDCIRFSENGAEKIMATWLASLVIVSRLINII